MAEFDRRMHQVRADQWGAPTPCTEWTVRDLVNHLVYEQLWAPLTVRGATVAQVGDRFEGDVLGTDPLKVWTEASAEARAAWLEPDVLTRDVEVSFGRIPAQAYGWQMTADLAIHAWDLAKGIGADERIDAELASTLHEVLAPQVPSWQGIGIVAPPVPVPDSADIQTRLLALFGRSA